MQQSEFKYWYGRFRARPRRPVEELAGYGCAASLAAKQVFETACDRYDESGRYVPPNLPDLNKVRLSGRAKVTYGPCDCYRRGMVKIPGECCGHFCPPWVAWEGLTPVAEGFTLNEE